MNSHHPKAPALIRTFLKSDAGIIHRFIQHIEFIKGLEQKLLSFLAPPLNEHCTIANYTNGTLLLHTDAPAWASRIRYNSPGILRFLQNECSLAALRTIRIKVMPIPIQHAQLPDKSWKLDVHTASLIRQAAATISDESLRHSLEKICERLQDDS